jgi:hypothetical protein
METEKKSLRRISHGVFAFALLILPGLAHAAGTLYGTTASGTLFTINVSTGAATTVGTLPLGGSTEIVINNATGQAWTQSRDGGFTIQQFDLANGAAIGSSVGDNAAFNGLQFIGGTLYGTAVTGGSEPSTLRILNPSTGVSTIIGPTGIGPIPGLAYNGTLYGISAGNRGVSQLYSINLATGAATLVGSTGIVAGSLAFGPDGNLYAGGAAANAGSFYRINPATGAATLVGATGLGSASDNGMSGLALSGTLPPSAVPLPPSLLLVSTGLLTYGAWRLRRGHGCHAWHSAAQVGRESAPEAAHEPEGGAAAVGAS